MSYKKTGAAGKIKDEKLGWQESTLQIYSGSLEQMFAGR
jgi:hypothetical protein